MTTTADTTARHQVEHTASTSASASAGYAVVAEVTRWPLFFDPCLHAEVLESDGPSERIRLWALVGGEARSWTSRRRFDRGLHRIDFRQEQSTPPLAWMGGYWRFEPDTEGTRMVLGHEWASATDSAEAEEWIGQALDRNSTAEIAAVRDWAERSDAWGLDELVFDFTDTVEIAAPAAVVYDFLNRADLWPQRLPHVARLDLTTTPASGTTAGADVQTMEMDTRAGDGTVHTTRSVRLCFEGRRIVYKQTAPPRPLLGHSGEWVLEPHDGGVTVTARHHVALDPDALASWFGEDVTPGAARTRVREILGGNSRRTLEQARAHAERPAGPSAGGEAEGEEGVA
ncbi:aromatase/cyclase [Streptacidiphilus jiangxiensis]|uniref:Aromatase n=1 Tax=Streptacidiphilus jiangxiensis TaxID=235985 RepID=A0A1H7JMK1_STRJI|nr:aromatase/cyclase [Streptacidiphilus jiangxiensis]SEK75791.1 aromatase [Streptacidiphilus jiangxiensis]